METGRWEAVGELLGIGVTHAPHFQFPDENMADLLRKRMGNVNAPEQVRDIALWPQAMRDEWGDDEGLTAARRHRETVIGGFREARKALDDFAPDFVVIWGDDQYENFREDLVPPFCVYGLGDTDVELFEHTYATLADRNIWDEPTDRTVKLRNDPSMANFLTRGLMDAGFDMAYSYRLHHAKSLSHAFARTLLYLDYDRRDPDEWAYPVVPMHVNCYGSDLMAPDFIADGSWLAPASDDELKPPAPAPWRCYDLGRALAKLIEASPWRVAVIGSSSWSHAFLTRKFPAGHPDIEEDRARLQELEAGNHHLWRELSLDQLREAGQHEFLNWVVLAGAMEGADVEILGYAETHIFNSDKCIALFRPRSG
jgi:Catalytic LigB subunit of aromatic ring-opening dioxygenase